MRVKLNEPGHTSQDRRPVHGTQKVVATATTVLLIDTAQ